MFVITGAVIHFEHIPRIDLASGYGTCYKTHSLRKYETRMHSSRMRTARSSSCPRGVSTRHPPGADSLEADPPGSRHPPETCCKACWDTTCNACWDSTPWRPAARNAGIPPAMHAGIATPWRPAANHAGIPPAMHAGIAPPLETCCKSCWDTTCNACWDSTLPPVNRITHTCKNITLPQLRCGR